MKMRLILFIILACLTNSYAASSQSASFSNSGIITGAAGTSASSTFMTSMSIGGRSAASSTSTSYASSAGILPSLVPASDSPVTYMDESPAAGDWQNTTGVSCGITVEINATDSITSVRYRISNSGSDESSFGPWQSDISTSALSSTKFTFSAAIPNASAQTFAEGENNYAQWRVKISPSGYEGFSSKYRVRVRTNDVPSITVIQPDEKGGIAPFEPVIEATVSDTYWGINANTVQLKLDNAANTTIATVTPADTPGIFTASSGLISYKYNKSSLVSGATYKLTISAADNNGVTGSSTVTFKVKSDAIADLVPYPSPFDPKLQPIALRYVLAKDALVSVNIYDMSGRLVKTVVDNQSREAGVNEDFWNGRSYSSDSLANGVYFCEIAANDSDGEHRRYTSLAIFGK